MTMCDLWSIVRYEKVRSIVIIDYPRRILYNCKGVSLFFYHTITLIFFLEFGAWFMNFLIFFA